MYTPSASISQTQSLTFSTSPRYFLRLSASASSARLHSVMSKAVTITREIPRGSPASTVAAEVKEPPLDLHGDQAALTVIRGRFQSREGQWGDLPVP